jgi:hypothetical protein
MSAGASVAIQKATTGEVNWGQVAVNGAFGATAFGAFAVGGAVAIGYGVGAGSSALAQYATTGHVDVGKVTISGVAGGAGGWAGMAAAGSPAVATASTQLAARGFPIAASMTPYVAGGTSAGFVGSVTEEMFGAARGEQPNVGEVAFETGAGGAFGFMGGAFPVVDEIITGTVSRQAMHLDKVAGAAGGLWTEHVTQMVEEGIQPPTMWPTPP